MFWEPFNYYYEKTCYNCKQTIRYGSDEELGPHSLDRIFYYKLGWMGVTDSKEWVCDKCEKSWKQPVNYVI